MSSLAALGEPDRRSTLLRLTANGDQRAFAELYDLVAPEVFGLIRKVLRDPAQSQEVAQEVMVEVWRSATRFDPERGNARTWIMTIAHRRAVDRVRAEQSYRDRGERHARLEIVDRDHQEMHHDPTEREAVRGAVATLTPLQRQSIDLAYYGGCTHSEIAELLEVPLGTIKTRIRDGLIRLRDQLGEVR
jgi:RNA polymerase sigma-70 factor, ECF subfamily